MSKQIEDILPDIIEFRHQLHQIPELAGQEFETRDLIRSHLKNLNIEVLPPFLETDTVAIIHGGKGPGKNVTLRADIDALAVTEQTGAFFASTHPGKMHACGHDVHTATLMGAAVILASRRDEFAGTVRLVWQPGEENLAMAKDLLAAGAIDDPLPDFITAMHVEPGLPVGMIGTRTGAIMASSTHFQVRVTGLGSHGSSPHKAKNALLAAATMVKELQNIVSNHINAQQSVALSVGVFHSGELENVIPDSAFFGGTIRALDMEAAAQANRLTEEICQNIARLYEVKADVNIRPAYAVTMNDPAATELARQTIREAGIPFREFPESAMAAEDFSYYCTKAPAVYVKLGVGEDMPPLHNCRMFPPDNAMATGIRYFVNFALNALK